ncbi:putative lipopolysaccharide heptosyltransferase III [Erwinia sp. OLTSP20]|uniref:putative lipopolysaccharide heptosyltransferase III n=1 Tax=unclassified Erwinia TaxID=2622719 RepID=UPI000C1883D9|nr:MULTISPECIES: putative lipopolysaccharide heptosyltransferase III [unclassified Erwinia]PIJ49657.1 putative lipopolysaccharide heptosyltransferase III [Erwinia sp. OAMSP11]PIJ70072.1 putative lipopolysaccharide heptosyltransferase III [Erwinia sp. OLSSP12]PIJ80569.1 putative lipopolysaccharide heptosyltransferase III [Erwinia sp. OLCASP19]PIJ82734.1 putative lipopolysaccharide heptosyltransferase III [Erwinia sp. OLMTSP26]PIJ84811.1 putative lipopolysaccharide heptosyltransferase III [Erwin
MSIPAHFTPQRVLVIKLRHHGDMLLTTPVINALHQRYPQAKIDVLLYKETQPMLAAHPAINQLLIIDRQWKKEGVWRHLRHEWQLLRQLRQQKYDLIINLADQWRSALLTLFSAAPVRIGFDYDKRQSFLWRIAHPTRVSTARFEQLHTAEQNLQALLPLGIASDGARASMHYHDEDWQHVEQMLRDKGISQPWIVIQPTSRWIFKCWSDEQFATLLSELASPDYQLVLTSAPDKGELQMITNIMTLSTNKQVVSLAGELSLTELAALIDHACLFIGVDSAPMHMAAALDTPCIALFGPTKLTQWRPWGPHNQVIWAGDYGALPDPDSINTHTETRYLSSIPVEKVADAARSFLND